MKIHESITQERILDAVDAHMHGRDNPGFCVACGVDVEGIEPDARGFVCEACGERRVYGAEELMFTVLP